MPLFRLALAALYSALSPDLKVALRSLRRAWTTPVHQGFRLGKNQTCLVVCDIVGAGVDVGEYHGGESLQVLVLEDVPFGSFEAILQL